METKEDKQSLTEKIKGYPKQILLISANEFCERFTFYGIKTILILYFTTKLHLDRHVATAVYHSFNVVCYLSPVAGAILADGYIGKYKTILYMSLIYGVGNIVLSLTAIPALGAYEIAGPCVGLLIIAIATGGIKPNISAFGGDQFTAKIVHLRHSFFSLFYFAINMGALFSTFFTPMLRAQVSCFGETTCYSLAFGVPAILMIVAILLFVIGTPLYIRNPPSGNIVGEFCRCIVHALKVRCKTPRSKRNKSHWLYYAEGKFTKSKIDDFHRTLQVLFMFLPLSIFWCLIDQQGSTWTLQAEEMNGQLGSMIIEPDQMQVLNPIFILTLIPFYDLVVYPALTRCHVPNRPLQRMCAGLILAALSYVVAGFVQINIDQHITKLPSVGQSAISFSNLASKECNLTINYHEAGSRPGEHHEVIAYKHESFRKLISAGKYNVTTQPTGTNCALKSLNASFTVSSKDSYLGVFESLHKQLNLKIYPTVNVKPKKGTSDVRFLNLLSLSSKIYVLIEGGLKTIRVNLTAKHPSVYTKLHPKYTHTFSVMKQLGGNVIPILKKQKLHVINGAVYTIALFQNSGKIQSHKIIDVEGNKVSMFLQIPQYFLIESAEILISVTALAFAYSQAPASMKSVVMSGWFVTVGLGDIIVVIWAMVEEGKKGQHENPSFKFFMFATFMAVTVVVFAIIAHFYKYVEEKTLDNGFLDLGEDDDEDKNKDTTPLLN